jgi:hypothetical protein
MLNVEGKPSLPSEKTIENGTGKRERGAFK